MKPAHTRDVKDIGLLFVACQQRTTARRKKGAKAEEVDHLNLSKTLNIL